MVHAAWRSPLPYRASFGSYTSCLSLNPSYFRRTWVFKKLHLARGPICGGFNPNHSTCQMWPAARSTSARRSSRRTLPQYYLPIHNIRLYCSSTMPRSLTRKTESQYLYLPLSVSIECRANKYNVAKRIRETAHAVVLIHFLSTSHHHLTVAHSLT